MVEEFTPAESEDRLYELVSEYLRRANLQAPPLMLSVRLILRSSEVLWLVTWQV